MTNFYQGLHRGPIDHEASSVINQIANEAIDMGATVVLHTPVPASELLARVKESTVITEVGYGICVGGDSDGIYGDGAASVDDTTRATTGAGQACVVVTRGRCPAKVTGAITIGAKLAPSITGTLQLAIATQTVVAIALQDSLAVGDHIIAVDVNAGSGAVLV